VGNLKTIIHIPNVNSRESTQRGKTTEVSEILGEMGEWKGKDDVTGFDNGVESNQLMRSLQKRLWEDEAGRRISDASYGPLFDDVVGDEDIESGTIYVLRSKSEHPEIKQHAKLLHKIGVTGGDVQKRIANAKLDPTFLMSDVDVVATYELYNINRVKLENLLHRFFDVARLDVKITDRFGNPINPREWFLIPIFIIDKVVEKIKDGNLYKYKYDPALVKLELI